MARICTSCGSDIPDGVAFCTECGTKAPADSNTEFEEVKQENTASAAPTCKQCGAELREGTAFCTDCGASSKEEKTLESAEVQKEAAPPPVQELQPPSPTQPTPVPQPQPQYQQPQPQYQQPQPQYQYPTQQTYAAPPAKADGSDGVVGTGVFFGTIFLFALPMIGFIACIIMCFAPKKQSLRNYAKANLIWAIIGVVIGILLIVGAFLLGGSIMDYINQAANSGLVDMAGIQ